MKFDLHEIPTVADEYVLGLLDEAEMAEVESETERNTALAAAVADARERFLPLDTGAEPVTIEPSLWYAIEAKLAGVSQAPEARPRGPSPQNIPAANNDNRPTGWRATAISAIAASLILAGGLVWSMSRVTDPVVVAVLLNDAGDVQAIVEDFGDHTANVRLLTDVAVPADKTMQVWTLPSREMGPMSLGLLEDAHSAVLSGSTLPRPHETQLYEITLEQAGGSPTGRPTGPILAKGFAKTAR